MSKLKKTSVDYRKLRPGNLNTEEFKHLKLLLFWPLYGFMFLFVERFYSVQFYTAIYCPLDEWIPFNEWFVIPYMFWFVYLTGSIVYTLFYDIEAFKKMSKFIIFTYSITIAIYLIWPTCQNLRPMSFERDNVLTRFMAAFYEFDTNTNVCPSLHVIGSFAAMYGLGSSKSFGSRRWKMVNIVITMLISLSTVFLKQHSILDVFAALPLCAAGWWLFVREKRRESIKFRRNEIDTLQSESK